MARRKANRMSTTELSRLAYQRNKDNIKALKNLQYIEYRDLYQLYQIIFRDFIKELEIQFKNGHHIALGNIGYIYGSWREPHPTRSGTITKGYYWARMKFARRLKMYLKGLEKGDFDLEYIDEYPDGVVTENGILRKRREDAEFFND